MTTFSCTVVPFLMMLLFLVGTASAQDYICQICGGGGSLNPGGFVDIPGDDEEQTTCAALWLAAQDGLFNETFCVDVVQPYVKEPCGCTDPPPPYICPICGGGNSTNPGGIIDAGELGQTTCAAVYAVAQAGAFNETFCEEVVQPIVKIPCGCTDPPTMDTDPPSMVPGGDVSPMPTSSDSGSESPGGTEEPATSAPSAPTESPPATPPPTSTGSGASTNSFGISSMILPTSIFIGYLL